MEISKIGTISVGWHWNKRHSQQAIALPLCFSGSAEMRSALSSHRGTGPILCLHFHPSVTAAIIQPSRVLRHKMTASKHFGGVSWTALLCSCSLQMIPDMPGLVTEAHQTEWILRWAQRKCSGEDIHHSP